LSDRAGVTVRRAYASENLGTRLHLALRWHTCPFAAVEELVPRDGDVLDAGCGHGLFTIYLALTGPGRRVLGADIDDDKLAIARRAAVTAGVADRVEFRRVDANWRPSDRDGGPTGPWDSVVEIDMLYLVGRARASAWVAGAAAALRPGGRVVVKELDVVPVWKARWSRFQEVLATRVLRITEGEELELIPCGDVVDVMCSAALDVTTRRLDRARLHPHYAAVGTRRAP
jgi:cyclopropane fatty-acyl-phospholipid synthase-like methyltransferase